MDSTTLTTSSYHPTDFNMPFTTTTTTTSVISEPVNLTYKVLTNDFNPNTQQLITSYELNEEDDLRSWISSLERQILVNKNEYKIQKFMQEKVFSDRVKAFNYEISDLEKHKKYIEAQIVAKNEEISKQKHDFEAQIVAKNEEINTQIHNLTIYFEARILPKEKEIIDQKKEIWRTVIKAKEEHAKSSNTKNDKSKKIQVSNPIKNLKILESSTIKNQEKLEKLGSWGFEKVYKVTNKIIYALKVVKKDVSYDEFLQFLQEYKIMNNLCHSNIVITFGIFLVKLKSFINIRF